jgi:serine/threonine protein kinase
VLITADGQVKVTDFGIARAIGNLDEQVTQTGS